MFKNSPSWSRDVLRNLKGGGRKLKLCQLTISEKQAFVFASTSAGPIFLKPPNDFGFLAMPWKNAMEF